MDSKKLKCNDAVKLFNWCLADGLLPICERELACSNSTEDVVNIKKNFSSIITSMLGSDEIINMYINEPDHELLREVECEVLNNLNVINTAMDDIKKSLCNTDISGRDLFYSMLGDVVARFTDKSNKFDVNIINRCLHDELLPICDCVVLKAFKIITHRILKVAFENVEMKRKVKLLINAGNNDEYLIYLLHNGSISGLYNRLHFMISNARHGNGYYIIKDTLKNELPKLNRSRQIIFTRMIVFIAKVLNSDNVDGCSYLIAEETLNDNYLIWNAVYNSIHESGIHELVYDDENIFMELKKLNKKLDVVKLCKILKYNENSYVNNQECFEKVLNDVYNVYSTYKSDMHLPISDFTRSIIKLHGIGIANKNVFNAIS